MRGADPRAGRRAPAPSAWISFKMRARPPAMNVEPGGQPDRHHGGLRMSTFCLTSVSRRRDTPLALSDGAAEHSYSSGVCALTGSLTAPPQYDPGGHHSWGGTQWLPVAPPPAPPLALTTYGSVPVGESWLAADGRAANARPSDGRAVNAGRPFDNSQAWMLAVVPPLSLAVDGALLVGGFKEAAHVSFLIAFGLNTVISIAGIKALRLRGINMNVAWAVFLVPVYLYKRAELTGQSEAITVICVVAFIASLLGSTAPNQAASAESSQT